MECLHAYGIHSATLQPETMISPKMMVHEGVEVHSTAVEDEDDSNNIRRRKGDQEGCQLVCSDLCEPKRCC